MRKLIAIVALISLASCLSAFQYVTAGFNKGPGGGGTVTLGQTASNSGNLTGAATPYEIIITTGSDPSGYKVNSFNIIPGATVAATTYDAIYNVASSGCGGGLTYCGSSPVCSNTTGFTMTASTTYTDTSSAITSACGTLAANTNYALMVNNSSATTDLRYSTTAYTGYTAGSACGYNNEAAGTWPTFNVTSWNGCGTDYFSFYVVLQPQ